MSASDSAPASLAGGGTQRIDKWLWFARVVKTRTLAAKLVTEGHVRLNREKVEKASATVRAGDVLTIAVHTRVRILKMVNPGAKRGSAPEAALLFEDLTPPADPIIKPPPGPADRDAGSGRPTKRERRQTDRLRDDPRWDEE
jgi:ribosome-associated heat shock protein Hsp15